jgi:type I restriction enzyme R subunit
LNEYTLNEYGRFDQLKDTVDKEKAKQYLEKKLERELMMIEVNMEVDRLLRNFIIKGVI